MEETIENIEIVFKLCRKPDAVCIDENDNTVVFEYDGGKRASFTLNQRKKDYLLEVYCLKEETAFFANEFVSKWKGIVDPETQIGNIYGSL